ncbi:hypothetical protein M422DRAFT_182968 [Sphaerobolus stellatus SS14]|uniref:Amine oxidase domain-containing protein n=1 Tax=Sphaerobolus stellatus (strain SS14) TaxID=990650 RepID=A0A0C9UWL7_SPHS4|nr:hypothetical protein M422DRAFT_182968 [Sphaerobolus stellatus SS14]
MGFNLDASYKGKTNLFAHFGRQIIEDKHKYLPTRTLPLPPIFQSGLNGQAASNLAFKVTAGENHYITPIGIIGAGVGGLYTGLILQSLGIPFEILESRNRTGGRLYTHRFKEGGKYDYFDVGAMRYPLPPTKADGGYENGVMKRLGELINYLGLQDKLIPYYLSVAPGTGPSYKCYNGVQTANVIPLPDFKAKEVGVSQEYLAAGSENIMFDVYHKFLVKLQQDIETEGEDGWKYLQTFDTYSLRAYLAIAYEPSLHLNLPVKKGLPTDVINWLETFGNSTSSFDRALSEAVLDSMAFNEFGDELGVKVNWTCFDGGSQTLSDTMEDKIGKANITLEATVISIAPADPSNRDSPMVVTYTTKDGATVTRQYKHVISTVPLPSLRIMDLSQCGLTPMQSTALRMLEYGPSIKIGIRFESQWWKTGTNLEDKILNITGGQSSTDLPIRTVVYPSYGNPQQPANVLIASYCWTSDADRIAALFRQNVEPPYDPRLKTLVLSNLATLHNVSVKILESQFIEMYPWDWDRDCHTGGAFAYFGPGQFEHLYHSLNLPTPNGKLHFASELLSIRHAWVVGALDSAWRAVHETLLSTGDIMRLPLLLRKWGSNEEWSVSRPKRQKGIPSGKTGVIPSQDGDDIPDGKEGSMPSEDEEVAQQLQNNLLFQHMLHERPHLFEGFM